MTHNTLEDVKRGAAWLDETKPGWHDMVDIGTLQMSSGRDCIAGQVFYWEAQQANSVTAQNGFDFLFAKHSGTWLAEHGFLFAGRDLWIEQIQARRADALVSA